MRVVRFYIVALGELYLNELGHLASILAAASIGFSYVQSVPLHGEALDGFLSLPVAQLPPECRKVLRDK